MRGRKSACGWRPGSGGRKIRRASICSDAGRRRRAGPGGRRAGFDVPPVAPGRGDAAIGVIRGIAGEKGCTVAQVALAGLLHQPVAPGIIVGARRVGQLQGNIRTTEGALAPDDLAALDPVTRLPAGYPGWIPERQAQYRAPFPAPQP
ncbi:aldo/keto reductase [Paracoccus pantotrophus]|uniref:Aldo/keto reductase n=1 Tax=Paracoccus pantotrophus TaxID=82367 RepID=A0AAE6NV94_PARPN|nr:aldo/keto reductase [Paracoccus pantotrophus]